MKIDLYTRGVLTVIAICLLWLSLAAVPSAGAAQRQEVIITGIEIPTATYGVNHAL